jgi:DEAD/DEAH box helicase domain-containing protein
MPLRPADAAAARADSLLAAIMPMAGPGDSPLIHVERLPGADGITAHWPSWVSDELRSAYLAVGVERPWRHQGQAATAAFAGEDVIVSTGTASGKSLAYQLPALAALQADDRARVLYLSPTKALAGDQLRGLDALGIHFLRAATYDGDTPPDVRDWVHGHANWVLTNPDMLSRAILGRHSWWSSYLRRLRYVVVDECHTYRGLFGSHVSLVLRRLRRICAHYGAHPVFVLASATVSDPAVSAERLIGRPVRAVTVDCAPRAAKVFALWEPPLTSLRGENGAPVRRAAGSEAARLLADLVGAGARTLTFVRSRRGAEITALSAQRLLREAGAGDLAERVSAYRAGFLPEERRALEAALSRGQLLGVAATNALELGIDISGLDAVVLAGYPGTLASLWQQSGRAGRGADGSLVVLVARDDPLDTFLIHHPDALFRRPVEATVFDPGNPYVLAPQLCCAAAELPLTEADLAMFGGEIAREVLDALASHRVLRRRPHGWYWTSPNQPPSDLRGGGGSPVTIVEAATGNLLGTVDAAAAHAGVHPGAVYLHLGRSYVVDSLDLDRPNALVHAEEPDWTTSAREITDIHILTALTSTSHGSISVHFGDVEVSHQVVSYQRRRISTGEIIDETPLHLPRRELVTRAVWYTIDADGLEDAELADADVPGSVHAAEHAAIGLLPLFATCDRWDIGGVSTALHPDTERATVFVYDGHQGGAGFAERGHAVLAEWLSATRAAISSCECLSGCPSCVQSPKCGSGNDPLDKPGAVRLLDAVLKSVGPIEASSDALTP